MIIVLAVSMGVIQTVLIDTTPGTGGAMAPPDGWEGDAEMYMSLIRHRYATDRIAKMHIAIMAINARRLGLRYAGPFADQASIIIEKVMKG